MSVERFNYDGGVHGWTLMIPRGKYDFVATLALWPRHFSVHVGWQLRV